MKCVCGYEGTDKMSWISVEERLPEEQNIIVLGKDKNGNIFEVGFWIHGYDYAYDFYDIEKDDGTLLTEEIMYWKYIKVEEEKE